MMRGFNKMSIETARERISIYTEPVTAVALLAKIEALKGSSK